MPSPPRLIFLVNSAARRLQQCIAARQLEAARAMGAAPTAAQGSVLFVLDKSDGATMGELAQALDLAPSAVSGLVQRMELLQWVARRACAQDARTQRAWLLPAGRQVLPALYEALARLNRQLKAGFTEAELQTVGRWLRHVQQLDEDTP